MFLLGHGGHPSRAILSKLVDSPAAGGKKFSEFCPDRPEGRRGKKEARGRGRGPDRRIQSLKVFSSVLIRDIVDGLRRICTETTLCDAFNRFSAPRGVRRRCPAHLHDGVGFHRAIAEHAALVPRRDGAPSLSTLRSAAVVTLAMNAVFYNFLDA